MKKVELTGINVSNFMKFVNTLSNLSPAGTMYFIIKDDTVYSDSYIESKTLIKSLRYNLTDFCDNETIEDEIRFTFYNGKKIKDAFSYLNGSATCTVKYEEYEGSNYCKEFVLTDGKISITLRGAEPAVMEFSNVDPEVIGRLTEVDSAHSCFQITENELKQIKSMQKFDTNSNIVFNIGDSVNVSSKDSFEIDINDNMDQVSRKGVYPIDKNLVSLIEDDTYLVYPKDTTLVFRSIDSKITNVVSLTHITE